METPVSYETVVELYPEQVKVVLEKLRNSKSALKNSDASELSWGYSVLLADAKGSVFVRVYGRIGKSCYDSSIKVRPVREPVVIDNRKLGRWDEPID